MNTEVKIENTEVKIENTEVKELNGQIKYDLENKEDLEKLSKELNSNSKFFKPENDVTYKLVMNSSKIIEVEKEFEDGKVIKYGIDVTISNKTGEVFVGIWEVGSIIMNAILKDFDLKNTYKVTKTGTGLNTRYNVVKDF